MSGNLVGDSIMPDLITSDIATTSNRGLVSIQSADELLQQDQDAIKEAEDEQSQPLILSLAAHIKTTWQDHKSAKEQDIEPRLLKCLRLRKGVYDAATQAMITAQGGTDVFIKLTKTKCRAAKSWMKDIFLSQEKPFAVIPTPVPELPGDAEQEVAAEIAARYQESIMIHQQVGIDFDENAFKEQAKQYKYDVLQELKDQAQTENEELETEIHDDLTEEGFYMAIDALLWDITTFPACVLKGPVTRMEKALEWDEQGQPIINEVLKKHWERISPFDIYPSRTAKNIQEGDFIERHRLSRQALHDLIGVEGYSEEAIRSVLSSYEMGELKFWLANDQERQQLENKSIEAGRSELIDALQFWGSVSGDKLIEWGMEDGLVATDQYNVEAWLIGDTVISAMLNSDPLSRRPYFSASYDDNPDSIWGEGVPELMDDIQKICNSFARAMVNNSGIASGPQVAVLTDLLQPGMDIETMFPWKIWQFKAEQFASGRMPIEFFQPNMILESLRVAYDYFFKQASEVTGIPAYIYGSEKVGGAGRTASGLSMLMNAANKGLKDVVGNLDKGVIEPAVKAYWQHIMLYEPDKAKGDINIVARASQYLMMLESLQVRRMEFLNFTNNPVDNQIIGPAGRAEILRETARSLQLPVDRIVPDKKSIIDGMQEAKIQVMVQNIAKALGAQPEQIMQMASGQPAQGGGGQPTQAKPRTLNLAGQPMGGM